MGLRDHLAELEKAGLDGPALLRHALQAPECDEHLAVISSFGAESVLLLALVMEAAPATPVLFLDTGQHFPETLRYRDMVARRLRIADLRVIAPRQEELAEHDPEGGLWYYDADACCRLRKVAPMDRALAGFTGWITGRKRHQAATRAALPAVELQEGRLLLNPLAAWTAGAIAAEIAHRGLPRHPLTAQGYRSIGCAVCTRPVGAGEDARAGRWAGQAKTECGIHLHRLPR